MAPNLAPSEHSQISDMLHSKSLKADQIAEVVNCSPRSVYAIKSNIRQYGSTKAPPNIGGQPRNVSPAMFDALCEHLVEKPHLYQDEMVLFLLNEFSGPPISTQSIRRALRSNG